MLIERICLYNCLHIVFELYGKESKVNIYKNEISIQLFYTLYLNRKENNAK